MLKNEPQRSNEIDVVLAERISLILALALHHGCDAIVLGAWGCGVFRNDPIKVAAAFRQHLTGSFSNRFKKAIFSVLDTSAKLSIFETFRESLESAGKK